MRIKVLTALFAGVVVTAGWYWRPRLLFVASGSMEPTLASGSLALIVRTRSYQEGDVVTYAVTDDTGALVTHRISEVISHSGALTYRTKGDANQQSDSGQVLESQVLGEVVWHWSSAWLSDAFRWLWPTAQAASRTQSRSTTLARQFLTSETSVASPLPENVAAAEPFLLVGDCEAAESESASQVIEIGTEGESLSRVSFTYASDTPGPEGIMAPALEVTADDQAVLVLNAAQLSTQPQTAMIPVYRSGPVSLRFTALNPLCVFTTSVHISNLVVEKQAASTLTLANLQLTDEGGGELIASFWLVPHERIGEVISYEVLITNRQTGQTERRAPRFHDRDQAVRYLIAGTEELLVTGVPAGDYTVRVQIRDQLDSLSTSEAARIVMSG